LSGSLNISSEGGFDPKVIDRAMKPYPKIKEIVPFSTPVVSFGNPAKARVLTVGINPSSLEFLTAGKNKTVLPIGEKRLTDLEVLGISNPEHLTEEMAQRVIAGCYEYFDKSSKPYMTWFKHLDLHVNRYFGARYEEGNACHLDLVQWATDPVWGNIEDLEVRDQLLEGDSDFLRHQIDTAEPEVVFINGKLVFEQLTSLNIVEAKATEVVFYETKNGKSLPVKFYSGVTRKGINVVGWSRTFPGHHISGESLPGIVQKLHNHFDKYLK